MDFDDVKEWRRARFAKFGSLSGDTEHVDWLIAELEQARAYNDEILLKDRAKTREINILVKENRELAEQLDQARAERDEWKRKFNATIEAYAEATGETQMLKHLED